MERGEFDDLPGAGKPIEDLGDQHDPDWWLKQLIEREKITGSLPPALELRKEDAELDALLDRRGDRGRRTPRASRTSTPASSTPAASSPAARR